MALGVREAPRSQPGDGHAVADGGQNILKLPAGGVVIVHVVGRDQLEAESKTLKGKPTIGTIAVGCALGYLDFRFASTDWRTKRPKLAKWYAAFAKLPSMKATAPPAA